MHVLDFDKAVTIQGESYGQRTETEEIISLS